MTRSKLQTRNFKLIRANGGFTLVELLVSISLVLVLMLAATQIFSLAGKTIGGGQAIGAAVRDEQAAQAVLAQDFTAVPSDAPYFVIHCQRTVAFRSRQDYQGDADRWPGTYDADLDSTNGEEVGILGTTYYYDRNVPRIDRWETQSAGQNVTSPVTGKTVTMASPFAYNFRNHRTDFVSMFGRGSYRRQTGNDLAATPVADMSTSEAALYFHHVVQPYSPGLLPINPGQQVKKFSLADTLFTNTTQLCYPGRDIREVHSFNPGMNPSPPIAFSTVLDDPAAANPNNYFANTWTLGRVAVLLQKPALGSTQLLDRSGVAQTRLTTKYDAGGNPTPDYFVGPLDPASTAITPSGSVDGVNSNLASARYDLAQTSISELRTKYPKAFASTSAWYTNVMSQARFMCDVSSPTTSSNLAASLAHGSPAFVPACTQFVVEFAGDFLTQDWDPNGNKIPDEPADRANANYGKVIAVGSDGRIDTVGSTGQTRWYGMPRDSNGDGHIRVRDGDVTPIRDVVFADIPTASPPTFEISCPTKFPPPVGYGDADGFQLTNADLPYLDYGYLVAWGPSDTDRPKLVRVIVTIDRPEAEGKLADREGSTFEQIYKVGQ